MSVAEKLNEMDIVPVIERGKIVKLSLDGEEDNELSADQYGELGVDPKEIGFLDEHPEGVDRGGWVPTLLTVGQAYGPFYSETACEWQG